MELYIHIPFCVKKCLYCDFLSGPAGEKEQKHYIDALVREIEREKERPEETKEAVTSIFFGGGTPSLVPAEAIAQIMEAVRSVFSLAKDCEITLEANPGTVTKESLAAYKAGGINRLSFGLQSADNEELKTIGRIHTLEKFCESYRLARNCGFTNINIDLMDGLPGQTITSLNRTLDRVLALMPEHISAYSLILEEGTALEKLVESGAVTLPDEELGYALSELVQRRLREAGYEQYEISNYARTGYACRHNIGYWTGVPYLGFGLGASGYIDHVRYSNERGFAAYCEADGDAKRLRQELIHLTQTDEMEEFCFLGLRMTRGISVLAFERRFGQSFEAVYGAVAARQEQEGLLTRSGEWLCLTKRGREIANRVMSEYIF